MSWKGAGIPGGVHGLGRAPLAGLAVDSSAAGSARQNVAPCSGAPPLDAAAQHDFACLYEQHFEFVWRTLRLLGVRRDALDDVSQDVFSAVARQIRGFEGRSSVRTWLFGIAQNVASNHRRMRARKLDRLEALPGQVTSPEPSPLAHSEGREAADAVLSFCEGLEEGRRAVFVLGLLEGVSAKEIAELLGIPVNTVYSRVRALRGALELHLSQREVEP